MTLADPRELPAAEQGRILNACRVFFGFCGKDSTHVRFRVNVEHHDAEKGRVRDWVTHEGTFDGVENGHILTVKEPCLGRSTRFCYDMLYLDPGSLELVPLAQVIEQEERDKLAMIQRKWC